MRALLYTNLSANFSAEDLTDLNGAVSQAEKFAPLIEDERAHPRELTELVKWTDDKASAETFHAWPLLGRQKELLGVLLVGSSRRGPGGDGALDFYAGAGGGGRERPVWNSAEPVGLRANQPSGAKTSGGGARGGRRKMEHARGRALAR